MLSKAMDELQRIVGGTNSRYIEEVKGRWADFCAKVQFYDVWKKALDIHWMSVEVSCCSICKCIVIYTIFRPFRPIFLFFSGVHACPLQCTPIPFPLTNFTTKEAWK